MNKRFLSLLLSCFFLTSALSALTAEFRVAGFCPSASKFKRIFGDAMPAYQVEVSIPFCNGFDGWANFDGVWRSNQRGDCCNSRVQILNGSFGLKFSWPYCDQFSFYLGLGPSFGSISLHNRSFCHREHVTKFVAGGLFKSGVQICVQDRYFVDLFVDYLCESARFRKNSAYIGGFKPGIGLGFNF